MPAEAVILAAGLGSRLKDRTADRPKGFLEIDGGYLIERSIRALFDCGIRKIIIGTGYRSDWYEKLAEKYPGILTVRNEAYAHTGSMCTLEACSRLVTDTFLLLESDLIYDARGLRLLLENPAENVILASGRTDSGDEVFIEAYDNGNLCGVSKDKTALRSIYGELTGISKLSVPALNAMSAYAKTVKESKPKLDYEAAMAAVSSSVPIAIYKEDNFIWGEIDNDAQLDRVLTGILPALKNNDIHAGVPE